MKSFFKKLFTNGEVLEIINSPINGEIKVVEDFSGRSMIIGGVSQSGYLVNRLWEIGLSPNRYYPSTINNCLILGLGCGNVARVINNKFPDWKIIGIEIDPVVIEMGKKYFGLNNIKSLKIIEFDAFALKVGGEKCEVSREVRDGKWDLVLVDIYKGQEYPKEAESPEFINGLKKILNKDGIVIFNRLSYGKYKKVAESFAINLKKYFSFVQTKKAVTNLLIFCQK